MIAILFHSIAVRKKKACNADCDITFFGFRNNTKRAQLWKQYICSEYFSETDFTLTERTCLESLADQNHCTVISHRHTNPSHKEPSPSLSSSEEDLHFLIPEVHSRMPITSLTKELMLIQSDTSLSSVISHDHLLPAHVQMKTPPFPLVLQMKVLLVWNLETSAFRVLP